MFYETTSNMDITILIAIASTILILLLTVAWFINKSRSETKGKPNIWA